MRELGSCHGKISREHVVSESVISVIADDGQFLVSGAPFIPKDEFQAVGLGSLTCKCLCERHNNGLHLLDTAAKEFFLDLRACFNAEDGDATFICSGHDIERWLLKTLKALSVSNYLKADGSTLKGGLLPIIDVLELLDNPSDWPPGAGLYCVDSPGTQTQNHNRFQIAPLPTQDGGVCGLWANIYGVSFILLLLPALASGIPPQAQHRPSALIVSYRTFQRKMLLSWEDGQYHTTGLHFQHLGDVALGPSWPPTGQSQ